MHAHALTGLLDAGGPWRAALFCAWLCAVLHRNSCDVPDSLQGTPNCSLRGKLPFHMPPHSRLCEAVRCVALCKVDAVRNLSYMSQVHALFTLVPTWQHVLAQKLLCTCSWMSSMHSPREGLWNLTSLKSCLVGPLNWHITFIGMMGLKTCYDACRISFCAVCLHGLPPKICLLRHCSA